MEIDLTRIKAGFAIPPEEKRGFDYYLNAVQKRILEMLPEDFPKVVEISNFEECHTYYQKLEPQLPLYFYTKAQEAPCTIFIALICDADLTHGTGRSMSDICSRWLIPGKQLTITTVRCLNFVFAAHSEKHYFFNELTLSVQNQKDLVILNSNIQKVLKEFKLCINLVQHTRKIIQNKYLTLDQKKTILQEYLSSLLNRPSKEFDLSLFDQIHHVLMKASAEEKVAKIKEEISPLLDLKPTAFDRDIFQEIQHFVLLFRDSFTAIRELKHLNRLISYQYLFRKTIMQAEATQSQKRHLSLKLLPTKLHQTGNQMEHALGVLIGINLLRDNEVFGDKQVMKAIQSILPNISKIPESYVVDKRPNEKFITLYLEVIKKNNEPFTILEMRKLKKKLARELKSSVENVAHPLFMHRNEEEVMRNILTLSKQLKYVNDIPQVIVNFHQQANNEISFNVILLRLQKQNQRPLKEMLTQSKTSFRLSEHEIKIVGLLRKRYPKEAHIFQVWLDKKNFLRKDSSLDVYKARQAIIYELSQTLGDVRDYNGGMISKQHETLDAVKEILQSFNIRNDFLLENFFYSLSPAYMQSLIDPSYLSRLFLMLLEMLDHDFNKDQLYIRSQIVDHSYLIVIGSTSEAFIDAIASQIDHLNSPYEITNSQINVYDIRCLGYYMRFDEEEEYKELESLISQEKEKWERILKCEIPQETSGSISYK